MSSGVTVLAFYDRISLYHTLAPWLVGAHHPGGQQPGASRGASPRITWTDDPQWCLTRDRNEHLIIVRRFLKPPIADLALMQRLRDRYRRIFFLNGNAGGGLHRPEVLPFVDRFYTKAAFTDRAVYLRDLYGAELFTDFAHRTYGIDDPDPVVTPAISEDQLSKIHRHWNIGVGDFPRRKLVQRAGVALARAPGGSPRFAGALIHRSEMVSPSPLAPPALDGYRGDGYRYDVNARLGTPGYPTIAFHRKHLGAILSAAADRHGWRVARDRVPMRRYFSDMQRSRVTFSPFGWGELCFRDFEAVRAGSLLIKPDMGHLETWPDIFRAGETYIPIRWDGTDLEETFAYWIDPAHDAERLGIVHAAHRRLQTQLTELPGRSAAVLGDLLDSDGRDN